MMAKKNFVVLFVIHLFLAKAAFAQQGLIGSKFISPPADLGLITFVKIIVDDQVKDGCWTNAKSIGSNLRLKFEQNDIGAIKHKMQSFNQFHPKVVLSVLGGSSSRKLCVGYASLKVIYSDFSVHGGRIDGNRYALYNFSTKFSEGSLFTSGSKLNSQLSNFFESASSELIADIIAGRRDENVRAFRSEYPNFFEKPPSKAD